MNDNIEKVDFTKKSPAKAQPLPRGDGLIHFVYRCPICGMEAMAAMKAQATNFPIPVNACSGCLTVMTVSRRNIEDKPSG